MQQINASSAPTAGPVGRRSRLATLAALAALSMLGAAAQAQEAALQTWLAAGQPENAWVGSFQAIDLAANRQAQPMPPQQVVPAVAELPPVSAVQQTAALQETENDDEQAAAPAAGGGQQQQQQTFGRRPQTNNLQFLRRESVLVAAGACQFDFGLNYVHFENDLPVPQFAGPNVINVVEGRNVRRLLYSPFGYRYGISDDLQFNAFLPVGWSNTELSTTGTDEVDNTGGIGDLVAGFSYLWRDGWGYCPDIITTISATMPTGDFDAPLFGFVPGSSLGQGFWALGGNVLLIHRYDPIIVFYGLGYRHLFDREFNSVAFQPGEQIDYQLGVGFAVNDRVTLSAALQGFYITETYLDDERVAGTNLEPISLRFATTISRNGKIIEPFATIGMTEDAPSAFIGTIITLY